MKDSNVSLDEMMQHISPAELLTHYRIKHPPSYDVFRDDDAAERLLDRASGWSVHQMFLTWRMVLEGQLRRHPSHASRTTKPD